MFMAARMQACNIRWFYGLTRGETCSIFDPATPTGQTSPLKPCRCSRRSSRSASTEQGDCSRRRGIGRDTIVRILQRDIGTSRHDVHG